MAPAPAWPVVYAGRKEAVMFIGEIEEVGVIEPLQIPRSVPDHEPAPVESRPAEDPVPAAPVG
jgi:hypothetical protein